MTAIRRGWFHLATGAGLGRIFGFVCNLLLSRWLGPTDLGLFNLVTTTVQTSDTLVRCGADYALNFELGASPEAAKTPRGVELARGLTQICSLTTFFTCLCVAVWIYWGQGLFPTSLMTSERLNLSLFLLLMIGCEGTSASAWELLLVSHRTGSLALRQGLFLPLRLLSSAVGALFSGVLGAMCGWSFISILQLMWLKTTLRNLWQPLNIFPLLNSRIHQLLARGLGFYSANLLGSIIFYPLLLKVALGSGLSEIGYLRVGQILQQLFAFLPATLVPVLFLKLRSELTFHDQVILTEKPLRLIWLLLLQVLLVYCLLDQMLITSLFGTDFTSALLPTRLLLITALFECLAQLLAQPLLASGNTRLYITSQNCSAIFSAILGWLWIPVSGLNAYLVVRMIYVIVPLTAFGIPFLQNLNEPRKMTSLILATVVVLSTSLTQVFMDSQSAWIPFAYVNLFVLIVLLHRQDLFSLRQVLRRQH